MPLTGTLQITGNLKKLGPTSDAVTLTLYDTKNGQTSILYQSLPLAASATGAIAINQTVNVQQTTADGQGNFTQGDALESRVGVDSRIDMTQARLGPGQSAYHCLYPGAHPAGRG